MLYELFNINGLSAQALASERGHSIPAAMRASSLLPNASKARQSSKELLRIKKRPES